MLYAFGTGEVPISVSALGSEGRTLVHTVRAVGAVTRAICAARAGDALGVRGPFGNGWPLAAAEGRDVLVMAGGVGLAPLRPAVRHLLAHRERFGRVAVLYGARTPADLLYPRELEAWRGVPDVDVQFTVDSAPAGWRGRVGLVTALVPRAHVDAAQALAMVCGPEVMMRHAVAALRERGVPAEAIFVSLERSMICGIGHCGHCQLGPEFVCTDGPVFCSEAVEPLLRVREL
jgi:NAD(P)H-flavin reductase